MSLELQATKGAVWSILASLVSRGVGLVGTLVLTHFLAPEVVGEVAVAYIVVFTANQLSIIGFGQYLVAKPELGREAAFHAAVLNIGFAIAALGLLSVFIDDFAGAFGAPAMATYVPGLIAAAFVQRVGFIPARILARDLRFQVLSSGMGVGEFAYVGVAVPLAAAGVGGHAIVWGNLARACLTTTIFLIAVPASQWLKPVRLSGARVRDIFRFGTPVSLAAAIGFGSRRWDNLVFAALFGPAPMALYSMAYNLADIPATQIGEHIGDVLLPSFARMHPARARQALIRSTTLLALVVFPLAVGLGTVAPPLVGVLLSDEWTGVTPFLIVLSVLSIVRPIGWVIASYLQARNRPVSMMVLQVLMVVTLLSSIVVLGWFFGPVIGACGVGLAFGLHSLGSLWVVHKVDRIPMSAVVRPLFGPTVACAIMAAVVLASHYLLTAAGCPEGVSLAVQIAAGAATYVAACLVTARDASRDLLGLLRRVIGGSGARPVPDRA